MQRVLDHALHVAALRLLDRGVLHERFGRDHDPARVLRRVARRALELDREVDKLLHARVLIRGTKFLVVFHGLRERDVTALHRRRDELCHAVHVLETPPEHATHVAKSKSISGMEMRSGFRKRSNRRP